ncbi:basic proline-rich protein-like isoform X2 [Canis lupus familiaris]|uniref:basic proline-rich protein-like isoform X2 n=1 Tax=Canis lupus familiaris TaxID=9615 RepID=UPI0018F79AC3|nr:basic proline-rich protein-like isoform X2 [Canis lupus familiaris]
MQGAARAAAPRSQRPQPLRRPGGRQRGSSAIQGRPGRLDPGGAGPQRTLPGPRNVPGGAHAPPAAPARPRRSAPRPGGDPPRPPPRPPTPRGGRRLPRLALSGPRSAGGDPAAALSVQGRSPRRCRQPRPAVPRAPSAPPQAQRPWLQPPRRPPGRPPSAAPGAAPRSLARRPPPALIGPLDARAHWPAPSGGGASSPRPPGGSAQVSNPIGSANPPPPRSSGRGKTPKAVQI